MERTKNFIVYSRRLAIELAKYGFLPLQEISNPRHKGWICWVFENTDEFQQTFQLLAGKEEEKDG